MVCLDTLIIINDFIRMITKILLYTDGVVVVQELNFLLRFLKAKTGNLSRGL